MGYRSHKIRRLWVKIEICITCFANNGEWEDKKANKRKFNYKKERGPKISHFWSPKESSCGLEEKKRERKKRKEEEEEEEEAKKGMDSSMELYGTMVLYGIICILDFGRDFYGFQI